MKPQRNLRSVAVLGIPLVWVLVTLVVPVGVLLAHSFFIVNYPTFKPGFVFDSYRTIFTDVQYFQVIFRTLKIALITATCALLVAYPLAYFLAIKINLSITFHSSKPTPQCLDFVGIGQRHFLGKLFAELGLL